VKYGSFFVSLRAQGATLARTRPEIRAMLVAKLTQYFRVFAIEVVGKKILSRASSKMKPTCRPGCYSAN
jgi:hypothetical protein